MKRLLAPLVGALAVALVACGNPGHELTMLRLDGDRAWVREPVTGPVLTSTPVTIDRTAMVSATLPAQPRKGTGPVLACVFVQASNVGEESFSVGPDDWQAVTPAGTTVPSVLFDGHEPFLEQDVPPRGEARDGYVCFDMEPGLIVGMDYGDGLIRWESSPAS